MMMMILIMVMMMIMMLIGEREREIRLIVLIDVVDGDVTSTCNLRPLLLLFFFVYAHTTYYPLINTTSG
jgi:hypothetical protein